MIAAKPLAPTPQIEFTNSSSEYADKKRLLVDYLEKHPYIGPFIAGKTNSRCRITFNSDTNPASVVSTADDVDIYLSTWYFEQRSTGYIMGMLCHEFGVHPIPSEMRNIPDEEEMFILVPESPVATAMKGKSVTVKAAQQSDHIFALAPQFGRYEVYLDVVMEMAILLRTDNSTAKQGEAVAHLLDCYMMDVASLAATNDNRAAGVKCPGTVAEFYNAHLPLVLARAKTRGIDAQFTAPLKTKGLFTVLGDYASVASQLAAGKISGGSSMTKK